MKLTKEDVQRILRIIDAMDYREVRLEYEGLKLHVRNASVGERDLADNDPARETIAASPTPIAQKSAAKSADERPSASSPAGPLASSSLGHAIRAPLAGVVYRSPKPGASPYVKVGQMVQVDDTVCLVEVMKLFQSVSAGIAGRITQVLVEDGSQIQQGQALFSVDPL